MAEINHEVTQREAILNAALGALAKHKISDITMRDIARSAGISHGTLHYHYPSKSELLYSLLGLLDRIFNDQLDADFAELDLSTVDKLNRFFVRQHDYNEQKVTEVFIDFWGQGLKDPIFREKIQSIYARWRANIQAVIQEGVDNEEFDPDISEYIPHLICAVIEGASLQYLIDEDALDLEAYFTFTYELILNALKQKDTSRQAYPSDLTDEQWKLIIPLLPVQYAVGRPRTVNYREIVNAILYITSTGIAWRMLPHDFPHWKTIYGYYNKWKKNGTLEKLGEQLGIEVLLN